MKIFKCYRYECGREYSETQFRALPTSQLAPTTPAWPTCTCGGTYFTERVEPAHSPVTKRVVSPEHSVLGDLADIFRWGSGGRGGFGL